MTKRNALESAHRKIAEAKAGGFYGTATLTEAEFEALDLGASEIACAVADAYVAAERGDNYVVSSELGAALDRLEAITRPSAMRKVRP